MVVRGKVPNAGVAATTGRILKPIVPPTGRDLSEKDRSEAGYLSSGPLGYASQGGQSDSESARLSNINNYKFNGPHNSAIKQHNLAPLIRKVSPPQLGGATMDYSSE